MSDDRLTRQRILDAVAPRGGRAFLGPVRDQTGIRTPTGAGKEKRTAGDTQAPHATRHPRSYPTPLSEDGWWPCASCGASVPVEGGKVCWDGRLMDELMEEMRSPE